MRTWMKRHGSKVIGIATLGAAFALVAPAMAAAPNVPAGTATIDGNLSEWAADPVFANMYRAGKTDKPIESTLKLRYDCATETLYAAVEAQPGVTIIPSNADNFVKLGNSTKLVDGSSPTFRYRVVDGVTIGWEASAHLAYQASYSNLNVHAQVNDGGSQTSAVADRAITIHLDCTTPPPTPVLNASVVANTGYSRDFDWAVTKSASYDPNSGTATYSVTATKGAARDTGYTVAGTITATNPTSQTIANISATASVGGTSCNVEAGPKSAAANGGTATFTYTCSVASVAPGTVNAIVTYGSPAATQNGSSEFSFGAPTTVTDNAIDVIDTYNNGTPVILENGAAITTTTTFTYTRSIPMPDAGTCRDIPNTVVGATPGTSTAITTPAGASVHVCAPQTPNNPTPRTTPTTTTTTTTTTGTPTGQIAGVTATPAALAISKAGPAKAKAGSVVTFTIRVRNTSTVTANNVVIRDLLPSGYAVAQANGAKFQGGSPVWTVAALAPGATRTVVVKISIGKLVTGSRVNRATAVASNAAEVTAKRRTVVAKVAGQIAIPKVTG